MNVTSYIEFGEKENSRWVATGVSYLMGLFLIICKKRVLTGLAISCNGVFLAGQLIRELGCWFAACDTPVASK